MAGGSVWATGDIITNQRMNQKTLLVDTAAVINALAPSYSGQMAYATTTAAPLTLDHLYVRNNANNAWNEIAILQNANTFSGAQTFSGGITMSGSNIILAGNQIKTVTYNISEITSAGVLMASIIPTTGNTNSYVTIAPSGTSTVSNIWIHRKSDFTTNYESLILGSDQITSNEFAIRIVAGGTGIDRPLNIYKEATKLFSFDISNTVTAYVPMTIQGPSGAPNPSLTITSASNESTMSFINTATGGKNWQILSTGGISGLNQGNLSIWDQTDSTEVMRFTSTSIMAQKTLSLGGNSLTTTSYTFKEASFAGTTNIQWTPQSGNTQTYFVVMPLGISTKSGYYINRVSDTTNWEILTIQSDYAVTGEFGIASIKSGTGTQRPINIYQGSTKLLSFDITNTLTAYVALTSQGQITSSTIGGGSPVLINPPTGPVGGAGAYVIQINTSSGTTAFVTTVQTGDIYSNIFQQVTLTNPSAGTVTNAATLKIAGGLIASTNITITNNYALWVAAGITLLSGALQLGNKITQYNGVNTVAWGIPAIYGQGRTVGATGALSSVATYTVGASDGSFLISAYILMTIYTQGSISCIITYTDENSSGRSMALEFININGISTTAPQALGNFAAQSIRLRAKASTTITITTTIAGAFIGTYNIEGDITQVG